MCVRRFIWVSRTPLLGEKNMIDTDQMRDLQGGGIKGINRLYVIICKIFPSSSHLALKAGLLDKIMSPSMTKT